MSVGLSGRDLGKWGRVGAEQVDDGLSVEQIEHDDWGPPPRDATRLVATVHALRRKPLRALTPEDLRLLVGQQVSLSLLVPRALALLEHDPLSEGDLYPGDVLASVVRAPTPYWRAHPEHLTRLERVLDAVDARGSGLTADLDDFRARLRDG